MSSNPEPDVKKITTTTSSETTPDIAVGYQASLPSQPHLQPWKSSTLFRSVLFQMVLFGALSFVGPAMGDAITNLGGGGLASPYLANLANSLNYTTGCLTTLLGGPLINKLGIKWSCVIAACVFPLTGSAYYVSAKYDIGSYLLASQVIGGIGSGFLYVAETTAMLSYPPPDDRGFYLGVWSAMRNSGSVIGGAINFSTNSEKSSAGGIAWSTYLIFVGFECTGLVWALLLSPTSRVRRRNGDGVPMSGKATWKEEFVALGKVMMQKKTWLIFLPAFYSFFYGGTMGTYLSLHFSVRSRALSSLLVPTIVIPMVIAYGRLLDMKRWSRGKRAWIAFLVWLIPQICGFIWIGIEYSKYGQATKAFDYGTNTRQWAEAYLPYLIIFTAGYWCQLSIYWMLGCLSTDVQSSARVGGLFRAFETAGQAISYGINSASKSDRRIPFYVNCGALGLAIPCVIMLIRMVAESTGEETVNVEERVEGDQSLDQKRVV
ncbi:uncharacterized protein RCC_01163 [Ramularia collo-cygni]|uniref:DUF895 domain membrane protein n=1 Tax=Ramularia collo-cygni TaxID=112498 RepID=A0A2D3V1B8_9PEZI|nr:uncharacterized protein RCC_01163 [Ramularia collo-cygni]CZT15299.1 uncharacterized protein RCC_01163 [Ramularia collo-cygni]